MKSFRQRIFNLFVVFVFLFITQLPVQAAHLGLNIKGSQAKKIYHLMTGPAVQNEGAAGHIYRRGKSVVCRYTDADMDDKHGHPVPQQDPKRYTCAIELNKNGLATPGNL